MKTIEKYATSGVITAIKSLHYWPLSQNVREYTDVNYAEKSFMKLAPGWPENGVKDLLIFINCLFTNDNRFIMFGPLL